MNVGVAVLAGVEVFVGVAVLAGALVCARMIRRGSGAPVVFSSDAYPSPSVSSAGKTIAKL